MTHPAPALLPALLRLSWPVALARLGIMGMGVADTVMVGQLAPQELPAQALGWAPTAVLLVGGIGLLTGVQVLTARAVGEGRPADAGAVWRRGLVLALVAGLVASAGTIFGAKPLLLALGIEAGLAWDASNVAQVLALSLPLHLGFVASSYFLEGVQRPVAAMTVMWVANILNIGLNAALIPHLGAEGSAWATVGARGFLFLTLLAWIVFNPRLAHFAPRRRAAPGTPGYGAILAIGAAASVSQIAEAGAFSAMTVIAGRLGPDTVAAYQILLNLLAVVFMLAMGVGTAGAVLVAEAMGRNDGARARAAGWTAQGLNLFIMGVLALLFVATAPLLGAAFTADPVLAAKVAGLVWLAALVLPPDWGQVVAASVLRARGDNWFPTASHVVSYVLVMPPLAYALAEVGGRGLAGLLEAIFWASMLSVGLLIGRWAVLTGGLGRSPP
jgi:MATE family multidrug resistance protein